MERMWKPMKRMLLFLFMTFSCTKKKWGNKNIAKWPKKIIERFVNRLHPNKTRSSIKSISNIQPKAPPSKSSWKAN